MKWHYLRCVEFTLIQCLCAVLCEGLDIHVPWNKGLQDGERMIFNGSLGKGWSYFMSKQSRSDSAYELLSLDSSSGCLYLKGGDICSLLESNPLEMKIQGRTHYHLHHSVSNYSVTTLNIHFQNLSCSVPAHRKIAYSSLEKHSILIVLFSNVFTKSESFRCFEKNTPILNLKQYIAFSLQSFCTVVTQDRNFFYNSSSSFVTSRSIHCLYSSRLKIPVILMPCTEDKESVSVLIDIHLLDNPKKDNDFSVVSSSLLSSHERLKRQTRPQFTEPEYEVSVPENQGQGYSVIHLSAYDPDAGEAGILTYSMAATHNTFSDNMFSLDPMSGIVTTTQALDREEIPTHRFRVTVTDSGTLRRSATATLIVNVADENDHTPTFDHDVYEATPDENIAVKSVIISVQATDGDISENADIRYSIISPPNSDTFSIDPNDGSVSTLRTLDRERQAYYQLVVQAMDLAPLGRRRSSSATINISVQDENDNAPQFLQSSYSVNVTENLDISSRPVIATISATDADADDNAKVYYTITNGNTNNTFYIDPITGNVVVQKELDYEKTRDFQLRIKASDGGDIAKQNSTTLWIRVEDLNDNPPYFQLSLYKGSISESVKSGTSVLTVHALDNDSGDNALLTYSLVDVPTSFPFEINGNSGKISVRGTVDREIEDNYEFIVQVKDNGNPSLSATTMVHITVNDVNDNSPVFTQKIYNVSVSEATSLYKQIVQVTAVDSDSPSYATLRYEITSGNTQQVFAIDRSTGMITLQKQLDYKIQNKYILTVRAYDNEDLFDSAEVHIDVTYINKEPPNFEKSEYHLTVTEGVAIGTSVGKVFASDTDFGENGRVTYEILDNIQEFAIDANTGEITTREFLDRELAPGHSFDVRASDHGNPSMKDIASVIVFVADANDNAPEFKQKIYNGNVSEAAFDNSLVLTVSATDDDYDINARITYKFAENMNGNGDFEIDESSGAIRVAKNNHIDREEQSNYTLTVLAVDGGHIPLTGTATVKIKVDDINDNAPKFPSEDIISYVPENQPIGSTVAVVEAQDPDEGVNAIIEYSIEGGADADKFVLSNQPGKPAYIINHIDLDYESNRKEYVVRVKAESKNLISAANVIIKVKDVNDNAPVLKDFAIIFNNYVDHFPNGPIGRIPAFDPDVSDQSKLIYKFVTGNKAGYLKLNESTGEITLNSRLNSDIPRNGTIQVKVTDGVNEVEATCRLQVRLVTIDMLENSVTIRINNMTSNSFLSPLYTFFIDALAVILNVEQNNIFVINVRNDTDVDAQILNVTVAVREKSVPVDRQTVDVFYTPEYLKEKIYLKRTLLANLSTLQILPFDDNLCIVEMCPYFMKCLSKLRFGEAAPFIASDTMLFRPIYPDNGYRCQCPEGFTWYDTFKICDREVNLCYSNPCQNGATCHSKEGGYTCECRTGFAGEYCEIDMSAKYENGMCPQDVCQAPSHCVPLIEGGFRCDGCPNTEDYNSFCELTTRSFPVKGSYLTYPTVKSRYRFKIQLRFATQEPNALLFYNGRFNDLHDFMALEIVNSQVQFSFSTGEQVVKVSPYIDGGVNDGKWHQVIVDYLNMTATVSVGEDCDPEISVRFGQPISYTCAARGYLELGPACFKEGNVNNCGQLLDLTGPLQIGGLPTLNSNFQIKNKDYVGCMKDFYIDNDLLDFNKFVADHGTVAGCDRKNDFCRVAPCKHGGTCLEGWDSYLCACPESWAGKDCSLAIEKPRTLDGTTYLTFSTELIPQVYFSKGWYNGISFRTRSANGTLLFIVTEGRETIHMQMVNGYIEYTYVSSGASTQTFVFNSVPVNDGQWHFFEVRWNDAGRITMDLDYGQRKQTEKVYNNLEGQGMEYVYAGAIKILSAKPVNFFTGCIQ